MTSRWASWSRGNYEDKKGFSTFLAEKQSPAELAKSMGLQSDGSGGYVDSSGQLVARTVNNELVFYDPQGGAISAQSGGAELTQAQPSWVDPVTGELVVPPGQPESPEEIKAVPDFIPSQAPPGYNAFMNAKKKQMYSAQGEQIAQQEQEPEVQEEPPMPPMGEGKTFNELMGEDREDFQKLQKTQDTIQQTPGAKDEVEEPTPNLDDHRKSMSTVSNNDGMTNANKIRTSYHLQDGLKRSLSNLQKTYNKEGMTLNKEVGDIQKKITTAFEGMDLSDPKTKKAYNTMGYMFSKAQFPQNRSRMLRTYTDEQLDALDKRKEDFKKIYKIDEKTGLPDIDSLEQEIQDHQIFDFDSKDPNIKKMWLSLPTDFRNQFGGQGWSGLDDFVEHLNGGGRDFITKLPLPAYRRQIDHQIPGDRAKDMTLPQEVRDYILDKHQIRGIDFSLNQDLGETDKIPGLEAIRNKHPRVEGLEGIKSFEDTANEPRDKVISSYRPMLQDMLTEVKDGERVLRPGIDVKSVVENAKSMGITERDSMLQLLSEKFNLDNVSEEDRPKAQEILDQVTKTINKIADNKGTTDIFRALELPNTVYPDPAHGSGIPAGDTLQESFIEDILLGDPDNAPNNIRKWKETLTNSNRRSGENWRTADRSGMNRAQVAALEKKIKEDNNSTSLNDFIEAGLIDSDKINERYLESIKSVEGMSRDDEGLGDARKLRNRLKKHLKMIRPDLLEDVEIEEEEDIEVDDTLYDDESYADVADMLQDLMFYLDKGKKKPGKGLTFDKLRGKIDKTAT